MGNDTVESYLCRNQVRMYYKQICFYKVITILKVRFCTGAGAIEFVLKTTYLVRLLFRTTTISAKFNNFPIYLSQGLP